MKDDEVRLDFHSITIPHSLTPSLPHYLITSLPRNLTPSLLHSLTPTLRHSLPSLLTLFSSASHSLLTPHSSLLTPQVQDSLELDQQLADQDGEVEELD